MQDDDLLQRLINHEENALEIVMEQYQKLLWLVIENILGNVGTSEDIEECLSDVFIRLWKKPKAYNPKKGTLKIYLCIMAKSMAINKYKVLTKQKIVTIDDLTISKNDNLDQIICDRETIAELFSIISGMKEMDKEVIIRRYFYGEKPKKIAEKVALDIKSVENKLYQSKQRLRNLIKEDC